MANDGQLVKYYFWNFIASFDHQSNILCFHMQQDSAAEDGPEKEWDLL